MKIGKGKLKALAATLAVALIAAMTPTFTGPVAHAADNKPQNPRVTYSTKETVEFGHYLQEDTNNDGKVDSSDEKQPIVWQVIGKDDKGNVTLISEKVLDGYMYKSYTDEDVTWKTSGLYPWLNGTKDGQFYKEAFGDLSQDLQNAIAGDEGDKVTLATRAQLTNPDYGFTSDESRQAASTSYSKPRIKYGSYYTYQRYWIAQEELEDPTYHYVHATAVTVEPEGRIDNGKAQFWENGVRPVITLNLQEAGITKTNVVNLAIKDVEYDTITLGSYNGQPITWRVLEVNGNDAFVVAEHVLDYKKYHHEEAKITWSDCDLRNWLNGTGDGDFYKEAFTETEQKAIKTTAVSTADNSKYGSSGGATTQDKIFLLSEQELTNEAYGYPSTPETKTDYRKIKDVEGYVREYWLRTPGMMREKPNTYYGPVKVTYDGNMDLFGYLMDSDKVGVVPAMHVNLASEAFNIEPDPNPDPKPTPDPKPNPTPSTGDYEIVTTTGGSSAMNWEPGSGKDFVITVKKKGDTDDSFRHFKGFSMNDKELVKGIDYAVEQGSTIITLYADTLDRLDEGYYEINAIFNDGNVAVNFHISSEAEPDPEPEPEPEPKPNPNPNDNGNTNDSNNERVLGEEIENVPATQTVTSPTTGDAASLAVLVTLMLISAMAFAIIRFRRTR
ncbi:MAG: hypothetical protein E7241_10520 [Lachnospiraceae bacterium]|nr:hypothetical protein [Lachnospiraceae bacterium]